jgi:hypothetical protein
MHICDGDEFGERWLIVYGERKLGDGNVRGLKVREEKIYGV